MIAPAALSVTATLRRDVRIIGLVSSAHFFSHFYQLALPSLFIFMVEREDYSYLQLGSIITVFGIMSGITQTPLGMMVDKIGARWPLILGTITLSSATLCFGLVRSYETMLTLAVIGGTVNAIYHPADFSILSANVHESRIGRAFSVHAVSGNLGWAAAPIVMVPLASYFGLQAAFIVAGCMGLATAAVVALQAHHLETDTDGSRHRKKPAVEPQDPSRPTGWRLLLTKAALLLLAFQIVHAMAFGGIRNFSLPVLTTLTDISAEWIASCLTGYLIGASFGNLAGGTAADRFGKPHLIFTFSITIIAALTALIGTVEMPTLLLLVVFTVVGALNGTLLPVRDLLVRAIAPKGRMGTLYGFTSSGLSFGNAITPLIWGWIMDNGNPRWIFYGSAILMLLALATYVEARSEQAPMTSLRASSSLSL